MAEGLPIVAFDLEGAREMAEGAGLLVPKGDPAALARALDELAADPARREELGRAARRRVEERYEIGSNASGSRR